MKRLGIGPWRLTRFGVLVLAIFAIVVIVAIAGPRGVEGPALLVALVIVLAAGAGGVSSMGALRGGTGSRLLNIKLLRDRRAEFHPVDRDSELREAPSSGELDRQQERLRHEQDRYDTKNSPA